MSRRPFEPGSPGGPAGRVVGALVGLIFGCIGVTVLVFLWSMPFNQFGSPPLFFRVFGSLIALAFVVVGGSAVFAGPGSLGGSQQGDCAPRGEIPGERPYRNEEPPRAGGYVCPQCSAPLGQGADVSPHGDVKCVYCNCWFNIHAR